MSDLNEQIEITTEIVETDVCNGEFFPNYMSVIFENQLVIMNTLKEIQEKLNK